MKILINEAFDLLFEDLDILTESYIEKLRRATNTEEGRTKLNNKSYSKNWGTDRVFKFLNNIDLSDYFKFIDTKLDENERAGLARYPENTDAPLQAHHIIFNAIGGGEDFSNLIALSVKDHFEAHRIFLDCITKHLNEHPEDQPKFAWAVHHATNSLNYIDKSKELIDDLEGEALDKFKEYISKTNSDKSIYRKELSNKGSNNLITGSEADVYELDWGGPKPDTAYGLSTKENKNLKSSEADLFVPSKDGKKSAQEIIYDKTGKFISYKTLKKFVDNKSNRNAKKQHLGWQKLGLVSRIKRVTDKQSHNKAHSSEYFVYFKYDNDGLVDFTKGYLARDKGAVALKKSISGDDEASGKVDLAYAKADEAHNLLLANKLPYKRALSNRDDKLNKFNSVMFIYADDLPLLQQVLNDYNDTIGNYDELIAQYAELTN